MQHIIESEQEWGPIIAVLSKALEGSTPQEIILNGDLGAGKTFLVRELLSALGSAEMASSPSYVLEHQYTIKGIPHIVCHWDIYRLAGALPEELHDTPVDQHRVIEWGGLSEELRERATISVDIEILDEQKRKVSVYIR